MNRNYVPLNIYIQSVMSTLWHHNRTQQHNTNSLYICQNLVVGRTSLIIKLKIIMKFTFKISDDLRNVNVLHLHQIETLQNRQHFLRINHDPGQLFKMKSRNWFHNPKLQSARCSETCINNHIDVTELANMCMCMWYHVLGSEFGVTPDGEYLVCGGDVVR